MPFFSNWLSALSNLLGTAPLQGRSPCSTMDVHRAAMESDADYRGAFTSYQARMQQWVKVPLATPILRVPVIVHFVGDGKTPKCSEDKAKEQITTLNNCFGPYGGTGVPSQWTKTIGNPKLEFFLPDNGPDEKPVKSVRCVVTDVQKQFDKSSAETVKTASPPEDPDKFLNVWVCNFASNGLATFPKEPSGVTQGIVVHYECFAKSGDPYTGLGHTLVHEVGHWLGLFHLWGDHKKPPTGDDDILDTPGQKEEHLGGPSYKCGCDESNAGKAKHMFMNFMDYTSDPVRCFFTKEQVIVMRAALVKERPGMLWGTTL